MIEVMICMVSLGLGYLPECSASLTLDLRLVKIVTLICGHVCHVRDDMVIPLSLSFVGCKELGRVLETYYESCS